MMRVCPVIRNGFTLIELLVVCLIGMILMGLMLVGMGTSKNLVMYNQTIQTIMALESALELYKNDFRIYPAPEYRTTADATASNIRTTTLLDTNAKLKDYVKLNQADILKVGTQEYLCDGWGTPLVYMYAADARADAKTALMIDSVHKSVLIYSYGPDALGSNQATNVGNWLATSSPDNKSVATNVNADNVFFQQNR